MGTRQRKHLTREGLLANLLTAAALRETDSLVVLSHGLGVETAAILKRWIEEPETRPFRDWSRLIVVVAQVGHEHALTVALMETHQLPELSRLGVRFVELARRGHLESDGIVVLQDTRRPEKLHPAGVYKLFDEMLAAGTVPQFSGPHVCAMKFKAFVIESWLAWSLRGQQAVHVWGYNAGELSRIANSDTHVAAHNAERSVPAGDKNPVVVFGFNGQELGRAARAMEYDGPHRRTHYPLLSWNWDRPTCLDYLQQHYGVAWIKSACGGCPFNEEAYNRTEVGIERFRTDPAATVDGLFAEYVSLCFNPNGRLYAKTTMAAVIRDEPRLAAVWAAFDARLARETWALYEVRRLFTVNSASAGNARRVTAGKAPRETVARAVRPLASGGREAMADALAARAAGATLDRDEHGIVRAYFARRRESCPTGEGFYVIAPRTVAEKVRGPMAVFDRRFAQYTRGGPVVLPVLAALAADGDADYFGV